MSSQATLQNQNFRLRHQWNMRPGVPKMVTKRAGPGWKGCRKRIITDLSGRTDYRTPLTASLPGGGSATVAGAVQNSSSTGGVNFRVEQYHEWAQHAQWPWNYIRQGRGANAYVKGNVFDDQMAGHAQRTENLYSVYFYGNGGGYLAKVDPNATLNTGDTDIPLLLNRCAVFFEPEREDPETGAKASGDHVEFSVDNGTGGAGAKAYTPKIVGARRSEGVLEVSPGIPDDPLNPGNPLIQPGDYVFIRGTYGNVSKGLEAWNPATSVGLSTSFYSVDRSKSPEQLAGLRIKVGGGQDVRTKWSKICREMKINGSSFNRCATTPEEYELISNIVASGSWVGARYEMRKTVAIRGKGYVTIAHEIPVLMVPNTMTGEMVEVISDEYLFDVEADETGQSLYRGWRDDSFHFHSTAQDSWVWADFDGNGPLYQKTETGLVVATYTVYGEFISDDTLNAFVAGESVVP